MKKFLCITFSVVILFTVCLPFMAMANTRIGKTHVHLLQEGDIVSDDVNMLSASTEDENLAKLEELIYNGLLNADEQIYVEKYSSAYSISETILIYANVINNSPDLFYVSSNIGYGYIESSDTLTRFYPQYAASKSEIADSKKIFNACLDDIVAQTDNSMNDLQKALTVHDYICNYAIYPNLNYGDKAIYHSAFGYAKDKNIVCAGYALIYSAVMNKLGIPCRYVISDSMAHAWNAIQINNKWYNVDLTWDDTTYTGTNANNMGKYYHGYFLKSTSDFETNREHTGMNYPKGIECTDTSFDDAFWNDVICNIYTYKGDYYYLDIDKDNFLLKIIRRDKNGNTQVINKNQYLCVYSSYSNGVTVPCAQLSKIGNILYFTQSLNSETYINSYDLLSGDERKLTEFSGNSNSLGFDDGVLVYTSSKDTYKSVYVEKEPLFKNIYPSNKEDENYTPYIDVNGDGYINAKDYAQLKK